MISTFSRWRLAAAVSPLAIMIAAGLLPVADLSTAALHYWVGDVIGIIVVTPFTLIASTRRTMPRFSLETALQIGAVAGALALIFGLAEEQQFQLFGSRSGKQNE